MSSITKQSSPFHPYEREIQKQLGVRERMERFGQKVIRDHMPEQHRDFYQQLPYVFVGHCDTEQRVWASILLGKPGFITSPDDKRLILGSNAVFGDPLALAESGTKLGLLGIELPTRRRNRLAATLNKVDQTGFHLDVDQSFGNCPQYIQSRELAWVENKVLGSKEAISSFDSETADFIQQSDTFFVASYFHDENNPQDASNGADVSHRGGKPGFIRVTDSTRLTIPDYLGNNHFNTFGNFEANGKAGLLFVDFERGHVLTLSGKATVEWESDEIEFFEGAQRVWHFVIERGYWLKNVLPAKWKLTQWSPNSLLTGSWQQAEQLKEAEAKRSQWLPYRVEKIVDESSVIRSFYLSAQGHMAKRFLAGQFLTVKADVDGEQLSRTYTLSSAPSDDIYRISVKKDGRFSKFLHQAIKVGDVIQAKAPLGAFTFDASEQRPAVLVGGGVGITPMISMARHALVEGMLTRSPRPVTLICAAKDGQQRAFYRELKDIEQQSSGFIRVYWVLSAPEKSLKPGKDFHAHGRISAELIQAVLPLADYQIYICGPGGFMQASYNLFRQLGISDKRIFAEAFGPASLVRDAETSEQQLLPATAKEAVIEFTESQVEQAWSENDGDLLSFAESHGINPEFSCRSGQCGSCKTTLVSGEVVHTQKPGIPLADNEVLICCAAPKAIEGEEIARVKLAI